MSELYNLEVHPNGLSFTATDAEGMMGQSLEVFAKWDGCMQIRRRFNEGVEENDIDNTHECDPAFWREPGRLVTPPPGRTQEEQECPF